MQALDSHTALTLEGSRKALSLERCTCRAESGQEAVQSTLPTEANTRSSQSVYARVHVHARLSVIASVLGLMDTVINTVIFPQSSATPFLMMEVRDSETV